MAEEKKTEEFKYTIEKTPAGIAVIGAFPALDLLAISREWDTIDHGGVITSVDYRPERFIALTIRMRLRAWSLVVTVYKSGRFLIRPVPVDDEVEEVVELLATVLDKFHASDVVDLRPIGRFDAPRDKIRRLRFHN